MHMSCIGLYVAIWPICYYFHEIRINYIHTIDIYDYSCK